MMTMPLHRTYLAKALAEHQLKHESPHHWQQQLISNRFYAASEAADLSKRELLHIRRTQLIEQFCQWPDEKLISEINRCDIQYQFHLDDDYSAASLAY